MTLVLGAEFDVSHESIPVAIIDDDLLALKTLCALVAELGFRVVGCGRDGDEAIELVRNTNPSVLLMDIRMQRLDGISASRALRAAGFDVGIVALTSFDTESAILDAVAAGVDGFFSKDADYSDLQHAIVQVHQGKAALSPHATKVLIESRRRGTVQQSHQSHQSQLPQQSQNLEIANILDGLSEREREVLKALVTTSGTNAQIALLLHVSESTVKQHIGHAQRKLRAQNRTQLALIAQANGI